MSHPDRWADVVDAVVGGADPRVRRAFALDRLSDPAFARAVEALEASLAPMAVRGGTAPPIPGLWERIEAVLDAEAHVAGYATNIRAEDAGWEPQGAGVWRLRLWDDRTFLAKVEAGHAFAPHDHSDIEHCVVIAGSMHVDGQAFGPGDYHAPRAGTRHGDLTAPDGLLLLIRYGD